MTQEYQLMHARLETILYNLYDFNENATIIQEIKKLKIDFSDICRLIKCKLFYLTCFESFNVKNDVENLNLFITILHLLFKEYIFMCLVSRPQLYQSKIIEIINQLSNNVSKIKENLINISRRNFLWI